MAFDSLVSNAGRLEILTALAVEESQDFVTLRSRTRLTDGNLSSHAKRLHSAGLVAIEKTFRDGKPVTSFHLTPDGRKALESHLRRLMSALSQRRVPPTTPAPTGQAMQAELEPTPAHHAAALEPVETPELVTVGAAAADDDWVD